MRAYDLATTYRPCRAHSHCHALDKQSNAVVNIWISGVARRYLVVRANSSPYLDRLFALLNAAVTRLVSSFYRLSPITFPTSWNPNRHHDTHPQALRHRGDKEANRTIRRNLSAQTSPQPSCCSKTSPPEEPVSRKSELRGRAGLGQEVTRDGGRGELEREERAMPKGIRAARAPQWPSRNDQ